MSLFFTEAERTAFTQLRQHDETARGLYWTLLNRTNTRAESPGLAGTAHTGTTTQWWHHCAEVLSDAAMAHALAPGNATLNAWLRDAALSIARRPVQDWVGPPFRNHTGSEPLGHLETAHLSWSLAVVLDLAAAVFTAPERDEIAMALREKGMAPCLRWLQQEPRAINNWNCVLTAGLAVAAAVLDDAPALAYAEAVLPLNVDLFQEDGSYAESLQYGHYAACHIMLTQEAIARRRGVATDAAFIRRLSGSVRWQAYSLLYRTPLSGWGSQPRSRSVNFNDSAATFAPGADWLLYIAARAKDTAPQEAALAAWLFNACYTPVINSRPTDLASFGFVNNFGFLSLLFLPQAAQPLCPAQLKLPLSATFDVGDSIYRSDWGSGRTVLAVQGCNKPLQTCGHQHDSLGSFILAHRNERLLADPGHSCYRSTLRHIDTASSSHNLCTFTVPAQEGDADAAPLELSPRRNLRRFWDSATLTTKPPLPPLGRHLINAHHGRVCVIATELAAAYGAPIRSYERIFVICDDSALFVIDRVQSDKPVQATWHWLLNNRDGQLEYKPVPPDRAVVRRNAAGMKLFHLCGAQMQTPINTWIHDAYHPLPAQPGEGHNGSGLLLRWHQPQAATTHLGIHAICVDSAAAVAGWHLREKDGCLALLETPGAGERWSIAATADGGLRITAEGKPAAWQLDTPVNNWQLRQVS